MKITAKQLIDLLAARHSSDVFVPECYVCATIAGAQRLDGWAMKKSWLNPLTVGYEIKVSRNDFLNDEKWRGYLPFCNEFYFVAPPGVIDAKELPTNIGLLVCSVNCKRLYTKKKAAYRETESLENLFKAILFSRAKIQEEWKGPGTTEEFWRRWLTGKQDLRQLGDHVSKTLSKRITESIVKLAKRQQALNRENENLQDVKKRLVDLGFRNGDVPDVYDLDCRLEKLRAAVPPDTLQAVQQAGRVIEKLAAVLKAIETNELEDQS